MPNDKIDQLLDVISEEFLDIVRAHARQDRAALAQVVGEMRITLENLAAVL